MQQMEVVGVRLELPTNAPIVLLREQNGSSRLLPIFIGNPEATSISHAIEGNEPPRPMTHDLMRSLLAVAEMHLERVVITELRNRTFFATLHLTRDDEPYEVSCRPSDAIALALRTKSPVFAEDAVLDEAGYLAEDDADRSDDDGDDHDQVVEEFRQFIEDINPEDFQG